MNLSSFAKQVPRWPLCTSISSVATEEPQNVLPCKGWRRSHLAQCWLQPAVDDLSCTHTWGLSWWQWQAWSIAPQLPRHQTCHWGFKLTKSIFRLGHLIHITTNQSSELKVRIVITFYPTATSFGVFPHFFNYVSQRQLNWFILT